MNPDIASHGLWVFRASRLEALLDPLESLLRAAPPANVLTPQRVIAAHPGMRHWLLGELARKRGPRGIVANLDVVLPSSWLDELAQQVLGREAVAVKPYRRGALRWRIHAALDQVPDDRLARYLHGDDAPRRRFQLADRLARIYSQYLVYRADWLAAWARDPDAEPVDTLLGPLWHRLRGDIGQPHRGERMRALLHALQSGQGGAPAAADPEPLHLFGISHLAPDELAVLRSVAAQRLVVFYLPDPCREYWGGLTDPRRALVEQLAMEPFGQDAEAWFFEQERQHPLLARWGRLGQHFVMRLQGEEQGAQVDERHWQDRPEADQVPTDRLARVQESIRRLQPGLMKEDALDTRAFADPSLRVHACHTRLRELEVLRDQLLDAIEHLDGVKPSDIVVMASDIRAYVPLIPAVFGAPGDPTAALPYHLADVPLASSHPVFSAFERLLSLPASRLSAPELLDLLSEPVVARRQRLDAEDLPLLGRWLGEARVAWGLDAGHRQRLGVPGIREHTFEWGLDRLLAGVVFGDLGDGEAQAVDLPDDRALAPVAAISGPQAELLGRLDRVLREVAAFLDTCARPRPASHWAQALASHIDALFEVDRMDAGAVDALVQLKRIVAELGEEPAEAGLDPALEFSVVREVLNEKLAAVPERQRFLMGGITVCGMVPQRAIPFRVVAVLGLNDGEFPRAVDDPGLDLMGRIRRIGDRDVRSDDRYLFLETVMSARDRLHLSYLGEGVRDGKPKNPAPPLAELLAALDEAAGLGPDDDSERPWRVRHPLQAFDVRYFLGRDAAGADARLFSYADLYRRMAERDGEAVKPFYVGPGAGAATANSTAAAGDAIIPLREVLAYFKDPSKQVLRSRLRVGLDALEDDRLADSEPLDARFAAIDRIGRRLFLEAAQRPGMELPTSPPAWLRLTGVLPPGAPGHEAWTAECESVGPLLDVARQHPLFADGGLPPRSALKLMQHVGAVQVGGELVRVHAQGGGDGPLWVVDVFPGKKGEGELGFRERIPAFIEWALLRLSQPHARPVRLCLLSNTAEAPWQQAINEYDHLLNGLDAADAAPQLEALGTRVEALLAFWANAQDQPPWYFPKTSWKALEVIDKRASVAPGEGGAAFDTAVSATFRGGYSAGEVDYAPGYARLLAGAEEFRDGTPSRAALDATALALRALITLDAGGVPA
ncbi:exodeoxyribonuclease V subunit gamma [Alkalisalibacterium limincola]|uniref:RecBCD enzyme subunit RecC n=1 Tax=Alkalisalibacterium limincola TaxID=2699169 RepID=A0A5C8KNA0_9GAMM|nr:exodeoxyribonuclease V subunit gamma [Alkalisalibacterium limincola]TXK60960.1 exodeoxyribonuclease V subunit gamma [Alkalisalibacterium limincola]